MGFERLNVYFNFASTVLFATELKSIMKEMNLRIKPAISIILTMPPLPYFSMVGFAFQKQIGAPYTMGKENSDLEYEILNLFLSFSNNSFSVLERSFMLKN